MLNHWIFENREILKKKITHKSVNSFFDGLFRGVFIYDFMSFANSDRFTSSFQFECLLFLFL